MNATVDGVTRKRSVLGEVEFGTDSTSAASSKKARLELKTEPDEQDEDDKPEVDRNLEVCTSV